MVSLYTDRHSTAGAVERGKIGAMILNPIENIMWNTGQYINSGFSSGDMGDIPSNRFWMDYGSTHGQ